MRHRRLPVSLGHQQDQADQTNSAQNQADNHYRPHEVQFSLEFVVAGRNSVERMINGTAFFPGCHGNAHSAVVMPRFPRKWGQIS